MFRLHCNYTRSLSLLFWVVVSALGCARGWHLAQTGLNESYRVRHLSLHYARVFLCIGVESGQFPTLIETSWPVGYVPMHSAVYPQRASHANGNHSNCELIQQAVWSQVDNLERLWVLDIGWQQQANDASCAPKLLVYDLLRNNAEVLRIDCGHHLQPSDAKRLVVRFGPQPAPCKVEKFIYFLLTDEPQLLAYDIVEQKWQRRNLVSKKFRDVMETPFPIKPRDMTFGKKRELLIADRDGALYAAASAYLQQQQRPKLSNDIKRRRSVAEEANEDWVGNELDDGDSIEMELLGSLLGPSKGMMTDCQTGALFYAVPKFGAVVRCEYKSNLTAEGNEIIYLTSKNIQQIFFGSEGAVWLLTDRLLRPQDHCFLKV